MNTAEKYDELEAKLDEAMLRIYELEIQQERDRLVKYELQDFIRSIYHECRNLMKSEGQDLTLEEVLANLSENIRVMARDYRIDL
jgi:hypothetical protein